MINRKSYNCFVSSGVRLENESVLQNDFFYLFAVVAQWLSNVFQEFIIRRSFGSFHETGLHGLRVGGWPGMRKRLSYGG